MSSQNQFFIVIGEIEYCRWNFYEEQKEGSISPGCVVVIRPCNGGNEFEVHRRSGARSTPVLISREGGLPRDKVVAITDQEFDILLGTCGNLPRINLHTSGRLSWACRLKVGDEVQVEIADNSESRVAGVIRGSGSARAGVADYGLQFVVEITESSFKYLFGDKGKPGTKFLSTKNSGIIVSADLLYPPEQSKILTRKAPTEAASMTQLPRKPSVKESLQQIGQKYEEMEKRIEELEDQVSNLTSKNTEKKQMMHQLNEQIQNLEGELQEKVALINKQQEHLSTNEAEIEKQEEIDTIK